MKDLYSVRLAPKQIALACEEYVLRQQKHPALSARAQLPNHEEVIVVVSEKRVRKAKGA